MKKINRTVHTFSASLLLACTLVQAQTCKTSIMASTPASDFTDNNNGTVTHNVTGLTWMRCSQGQSWNGINCTGVASKMDWQSALQVAENAGFAGNNDWRLPNIKELSSIVEVACFSPAINATIFPATPSHLFWSSSPRGTTRHSGLAWEVNFETGDSLPRNTDNQDDYGHVRLVRGGL